MSLIAGFEIAQAAKQIAEAIGRIPRPVVSGTNPILGLRDLRGYWPMNIHGPAGAVTDLSGGIGELENTDAQFDIQAGRNVIEFDGSTSILEEPSPYRSGMNGFGDWTRQPKGVTMGGWVQLTDTIPQAGFLSRWSISPLDAGFVLAINNRTPTFLPSTNGSSIAGSYVGVAMDSSDPWTFIACRLKCPSGAWPTSVEITLWTDTETNVYTPTWTDSMNNADAPFRIGLNPYYSPSFPVLSAYVRDVFICDCL